jgi:hypothetical protein
MGMGKLCSELTNVVSAPFNCRNSRVYYMVVTCKSKVTPTTIITGSRTEDRFQ